MNKILFENVNINFHPFQLQFMISNKLIKHHQFGYASTDAGRQLNCRINRIDCGEFSLAIIKSRLELHLNCWWNWISHVVGPFY